MHSISIVMKPETFDISEVQVAPDEGPMRELFRHIMDRKKANNPDHRITSYNVCYTKLLRTRLGRYYNVLFIALLFSATIFLLFLIVPGESRFRYEFQKNAPWRHETLIAPFDFAIYKPDEAVKAERDTVKKQFIPYYLKDSLTSIQQCKNLEIELNTLSGEIAGLTDQNKQAIVNTLSQIYKAGIISQSPETHPILKDKKEIFVVQDKIIQEVMIDSIYSLKTAFQAVSDTARILLKESYNQLNQNTNLADYIQANLNYGEEYNLQELNKALNAVSETVITSYSIHYTKLYETVKPGESAVRRKYSCG